MLVCGRCRSIYGRAGKFCGIDGEPLVELATDPLIGYQIDRYTIVDLIGRGGMGSVYKVFHRELETEMAMKVLFGDLGSDPTFVARFRREAQVASKIRSPNVVTVVDFGTTNEGLTYLVMEYIQGMMLDELLASQGALAPKRAARIIGDIALGLGVVHRMGFVHRDVKPANIALIQEAGKEVAKLLDFGIVHVASSSPDETKLTGADMIVGTPAYMSPEQAMGDQVTPKSDLYSLGVVAYELISGKRPFPGSRSEVLSMLTTKGTQPAKLARNDGLAQLTYRLMSKDPAQRPESAEEVSEIAARIATEFPTGTTTVTMIQPQTKAGKAAALIVAGVVGVGALVGTFVLGGMTAQPPPKPAIEEPTSEALETELRGALSARGLVVTDLGEISETRTAYQAWLQDKARDPVAGRLALQALLPLARQARATKDLLSKRLEALDGTLAAFEASQPEQERQSVRAQYLEFFKRLNNDTDFDALAKDIQAFSLRIGAKNS